MAFFNVSPLRSSVTSALLEAVKHVTPVSTTSRLSEGQLTPEEFTAAGDELYYNQRSWQWRAAPTDRSPVSYLPADKQMLVCERIPCSTVEQSRVQTGGDGFQQVLPVRSAPEVRVQGASGVAARPPSTVDELLRQQWDVGEADDFDGVVRSSGNTYAMGPHARYYSVYILYDHYYRVPRMYLQGFDGRTGVHLSPDDMRQDLRPEQRDVTATLERHPYTGQPCLSIHPCRHAQFMKSRLAQLVLPSGVDGDANSESASRPGQAGGTGQGTAESSSGSATDYRIRYYMPLLLKVLSAAMPGLQGHDVDAGMLVLMNVEGSRMQVAERAGQPRG